jgi:hypothetical protein
LVSFTHHPFQNVDVGEAKHEPKRSPSRYEVALRSLPRSTVVSAYTEPNRSFDELRQRVQRRGEEYDELGS